MAILVVLLDILREFGLLGFGPLVHQFDDVLFEHHITGHALHHLFQLVELRYHSWQGDVFRFQIQILHFGGYVAECLHEL